MPNPLTANLTNYLGEFWKQTQRWPSVILMSHGTFFELQNEAGVFDLNPDAPSIPKDPKFGGVPVRFRDRMPFGAVASPLPA